jgi:uncharacterized delta-60 repeat protein
MHGAFATCSVAVVAAVVVVGASAAGRQEAGFGHGGMVTTVFAGSYSQASALLLERDGKLVAAGSSSPNVALARYDKKGRLDRTFGHRGTVETTIASAVYALVIDPDGKIVVAAGDVGGSITLVRFDRGGRLDRSFGNGGTVTTALTASFAQEAALALESDGKLVVAGGGGNSLAPRFMLARYDKNGRLDRSFGNSGSATITFGDHSYAAALVIQPDGKLVAAGSGYNGHNDGFALARFDQNGHLDRAFGYGGVVRPARSKASSYASALVLQPDGKLVAAGTYDGCDCFALTRYDKNGSLDRSFGNMATVTTQIGTSSYVSELVLQPDGKLVAVGSGFGQRSGLARYDKNGRLDRAFGNGGTVTPAYPKFYAAKALVLQPDGKLVVAGTSRDGFALVRYDKNGRLDR